MKLTLLLFTLLVVTQLHGHVIFKAKFDSGFNATGKENLIKATLKKNGIGLSNEACPANPDGKSFDQQNVSTKSERAGYIFYPIGNIFPTKEGTVSLWVYRNGGGTYNSFIGLGNALWDKKVQFNVFYDTAWQKLYFRLYGLNEKQRLNAIINCNMEKYKWYHIVFSWKYDESKQKMFLDGWLGNANNNTPRHTSASAEWHSKAFPGSSCKLWIGSSISGLTPANSLIDEVEIRDKYLNYQELSACSPMRKNTLSPRLADRNTASRPYIAEILNLHKELIPLPQLKSIPAIDGKINNDLWQKLSIIPVDFVLGKYLPAQDKTEVGLGWVDDQLYVIIKSHFAKNASLIAQVEKQDGPVFLDDCVELFIASKDSKSFCHWIINSKGTVFDERNRNVQWSGKIKSQVSCTKNYWIAELLVPVNSLNLGKFTELKLNVARNNRTLVPCQLSSMVILHGSTFYDFSRFASINLMQSSDRLKIRHNFVAGPAGQNGINTEISFSNSPKSFVFKNIIYDSGVGNKILYKEKAENTQIPSFDFFYDSKYPIVQQIVISKAEQVVANIVQPITTQPDLKKADKKVSKQDFPWIGNKLGINEKVPAPFIPIRFDGKNIQVIEKNFCMGKNSIFSSIIASGKELLSEDIRIRAFNNSKELNITLGNINTIKKSEDKLHISRQVTIDGKPGILSIDFDFDGFAWCKLKIKHLSVDTLFLEIPLAPENIFNLWTRLPVNMAKNEQLIFPEFGKKYFFRFMPFIYGGNDERGFCFSVEDCKSWKLENIRKAFELQCDKKAYRLKIYFVNKQTILKNTEFEFGLQALPAKPVKFEVDNSMAWANIHFAGKLLQKLDDYPGQNPDFIQWLAEQGVKNLVIFNYWAKYQGGHISVDPEELKNVVKKCHKNGIKVLLYRSTELSTADPNWELFSENSLLFPSSYGFRRKIPVEQISYGYCHKSIMKDYFIWSCDWLMEEYDVDGFYLDSPACSAPCSNDAHGCGYSENGSIALTHSILATRELMRRLYRIVKARKPDGLLDAHSPFPITAAFVTGGYTGEQFFKLRHFDDAPLNILPMNCFRAIFKTSGLGFTSNMLIYDGCPFIPDEANSMAFINRVSPRPHSIENITGRYCLLKTAPIWHILKKFGASEAKWNYYWEDTSKIKVSSNPEWLAKDNFIKVTSLQKGNKWLYLISNFGVYACRVNIYNPELKNLKCKAVDALTGKSVEFKNGMTWKTIPVYKLNIIEITPDDK